MCKQVDECVFLFIYQWYSNKFFTLFYFIGFIDASSLLCHAILCYLALNNTQWLYLNPIISTSFYLASKARKCLWSRARGQTGKHWNTLENAFKDTCYLNFLSLSYTLPTVTCCDSPEFSHSTRIELMYHPHTKLCETVASIYCS